MNVFNNLLDKAAGFFGAKEQREAELELARLGLQTQVAATAQTPVTPAPSAQWIPGIDNTVVMIGGGVIVLGGLLLALRK